MQILWSKDFEKRYRKVDRKIKKSFNKRVELFETDPFHSLLDNHSLHGKWKGYRSINVTGDWRAVFKMTGARTAYFVEIGTHPYLYGT